MIRPKFSCLCSLVLLLLSMTVLFEANGQNYNSNASGSWTSSIWTNTSGWGAATPPLSGQGSGTVNVNHDITISGNYTSSGSITVNVNAGKTLAINGNLSTTGGSTINVYGTLIVTGSATLSSPLRIHPGGKVIVEQSISNIGATNLHVGTNVAPPPYADLIVYGDYTSSGGDAIINRNGRVAIFGDLVGNGGGILFTINNGGQVYVHGDVSLSAGGNHVRNHNTTNPYGLYVNGSTSHGGGGSSIATNIGDEDAMENTNPDFYDWVSGIEFGPLPVELLYFMLHKNDNNDVQLEWATATEINASHFEIQRADYQMNFVSIGRAEASGNSNEKKTYSFTDDSPLVNRTYYRLKQVDFDGEVSYSGIRAIDIVAPKAVAVAPNPIADGQLKFKLNFTSEYATHVTVTDISGRSFIEFDLKENTFEVPVSLDAGVYFLHVRSGSDVLVSRFVVQ